MIQIIYNIASALVTGIWFFILTVFTGKLPKISYYHFDHQTFNNSFFDVCSDKYKVINRNDMVHEDCQKRIIKDFLLYLQSDKNFKNPISEVDFPIFDGKHIMGSTNINGVMQKSLIEYFNK